MIAFVLGGGGLLGASEVGMLHALVDAGIRPDLVLGTSVGAINGAAFAADPSLATVDRLVAMWGQLGRDDVFGGSLRTRVTTLARSGTHLHDNGRLRALVERESGDRLLESLPVSFQCVAASIERATAQWFDHGPLVDAVLASCAVPGLLPPVAIDGEHYLDGGLVDSIPVGRAVELGADEIYVLQVGRIEKPLRPPRRPWEVASVAFEIARRHRFSEEMARLPGDTRVHLMPTGGVATALTTVRYRDTTRTVERIRAAHVAGAAFLSDLAG